MLISLRQPRGYPLYYKVTENDFNQLFSSKIQTFISIKRAHGKQFSFFFFFWKQFSDPNFLSMEGDVNSPFISLMTLGK